MCHVMLKLSVPIMLFTVGPATCCLCARPPSLAGRGSFSVVMEMVEDQSFVLSFFQVSRSWDSVNRLCSPRSAAQYIYVYSTGTTIYIQHRLRYAVKSSWRSCFTALHQPGNTRQHQQRSVEGNVWAGLCGRPNDDSAYWNALRSPRPATPLVCVPPCAVLCYVPCCAVYHAVLCCVPCCVVLCSTWPSPGVC